MGTPPTPFDHRWVGAVLLCLAMSSATAENLRLNPVSRAVVEARLGEYGGSNGKREATLKRMFGDAGCGERVSEQPVRGSRVPNLICMLPGSSGRFILVGA